MSQSIESYIVSKALGSQFIHELRKLDPKATSVVNTLIDTTNPSANNLSYILQLSREIAQLHKKPLSSILNSFVSPLLATTSKSNRKKALTEIKQSLEKTRYPIKSMINQKIELHKRTIRKELGVSVGLPENLEGNKLTLTITAKSTTELQQYSDKLQQLSIHPSCKALFSLLQGEDEVMP